MKGVTKGNIKKYALNEFLTEYKELNTDNKYRPVAVGRYGIRKRESIYSKELAKDYSKNKLIHKGTLTVGMGSKQIDIGILIEDEIFAVSPAYHTYEIQGIRCKYLEYCLRSKNIEMFSLYAKRGSRQGKSIDLKRWLTYKIPVYSEKDQIVIEENLNKINYVIELRRKQIDLLDELVKARFVEMFGDENNSKGWEIVNIEDVVNVQVGVVIKPSQYYTNRYNGIKAFRSLNIGNGYIKDDDWVYFSKEGNKKNKKSILSTNDVLVVRSGAPGTACVVTSEYAGSNAIDVIIAHPDFQKVDSHYLCTYTNMPHGKSQIIEGTGGAAQQHFNVGKYNKLKLMLPPLEYQKQYVKFLEEIDKSRLLNICLKSLVESVLKIRIFSEYKKSS